MRFKLAVDLFLCWHYHFITCLIKFILVLMDLVRVKANEELKKSLLVFRLSNQYLI